MTPEPKQENYDLTTLDGASEYIADWTHWIVNATDEEYAEAGYDPAYGARPVRRAVRDHLLNPLARSLIGHDGGETEGLQLERESSSARTSTRRTRTSPGSARRSPRWTTR